MAISQYYVDPDAGDNLDDGSLSTPWKTVQYALDNITQNTTDGDQINIKAGVDDVLTAALSLTTYGTPALAYRLIFRGYTSVAKDGGIGGISGNGSYTMFAPAPSHIVLIDLHLHNSGAEDVANLNDYCYMDNCEVNNSTGDGIYADAYCIIRNCYVHDTGYYAGRAGAGTIFDTCVFVSGSINCRLVSLSGSYSALVNSILIMHRTAFSIITTNYQRTRIINNTIYSSVACGGTAISLDTPNGVGLVENNYIEGISGVGGTAILVVSADDKVLSIRNNRYFNNTTHLDIVGEVLTLENNSALSASALADPANGDFSVNTDLKAGAYPTTFKGISTDQFMDIGAAQREEPVGGGGLLVHPGMGGGARG